MHLQLMLALLCTSVALADDPMFPASFVWND